MPLINCARADLWIAQDRRAPRNPAALIIHGAGGSHLSFPGEMSQIGGVEPILVDLKGHGQSPGSGRDRVSDYADDIVALFDALEIGAAVVIGHSMGGAIAQTLALDYADRVKALILIATAAKFAVNPALIDGIVDDPGGTLDTLDRWLWAPETPSEQRQQATDTMRETDPAVFRRDLIACQRFDACERLPEISCETLVLAGDADKMTSLELSRELAREIPQAKLAQVPGGSHMFMLEQAEMTARTIESWLQVAL